MPHNALECLFFAKLFFQPNYCGEPNMVVPGYCPQGLNQVGEFIDSIVVLQEIVILGHSWSSHTTDTLL